MVVFLDAAGNEASRWCPDGLGFGTHAPNSGPDRIPQHSQSALFESDCRGDFSQLEHLLPQILSYLDAQSLACVTLVCRSLALHARSEALWNRLCLDRHWRLRTCNLQGRIATWRELYAHFIRLSPEERWEIEWEGGGFAAIPPQDYFCGSQQPRVNKPGDVKFSVGQVIVNVSGPYRGVVVGWDEVTKVPKHWPSLSRARQPWLSKPHYSILVDGGFSTYIVDDNMRLEEKPQKVHHPEVYDYFTHFDGKQYCPVEALRALYPEDDYPQDE